MASRWHSELWCFSKFSSALFHFKKPVMMKASSDDLLCTAADVPSHTSLLLSNRNKKLYHLPLADATMDTCCTKMHKMCAAVCQVNGVGNARVAGGLSLESNRGSPPPVW